MTLAVMNREQVWKVVGVLLLAVGLQLFCGLQLCAQQADLDADAAAKAAADREALTRAPAAVPGPVGTFITFDVPGAVNGTYPASINRQERSRDITMTQTSWVTASCGRATALLPRLMLRVP